MYLKGIVLENFKSFGSKVSIPFLPGFTAITGPNGSGKSNIVDAILFVLGVRSPKMMRAGKLIDLIYKGDKEAKYCKVSLIFDNSSRAMPIDSDEVVLTRKIKISPLPDNPLNFYSYFYINGKSASLNEFIDLLSSANISPNSIVQQGDVTAIVEMGDMQRRKIIDEIAGIADFDREIEKAQREREEVERNMEHIEIILGEIKKQIRQLKRERDEALKYKELTDELEKSKAMLSYKKRMEIEREMNEVMKQIESYEKNKQSLEEEVANLKKKYKDKQIEFQEIEDKLAEMGGEELLEIKEKIDFFKEESIKAKEKINYYRKEIAERRGEIEEIEGMLGKVLKEEKQYENKIKNYNKELEKIGKEIKKKEEELAKKKKEVESSDERAMQIGREIAKIKKEYEKLLDEIHVLKLEKDRINKQKESVSLQLNELRENKNSFEFELKELKWEISQIRKEEKERSSRKERLEKNLFEKKRQEAEIGERLREIDKEILHIQRELSKLKAREDASSFSVAAREILRLRDEGVIKGIHGSIAELGEAEEKYRRALEVAAGRRIEAIVVEDDEIAAKCIEYLKKNGYGRVTFLPLNKLVKGKPRGKALLVVRNENAIGFAIDLISFDKRYEAAFWYVFGDTIVVDSLNTARSLMGGVRLVTLDGELIESSGAITGGSLPEKSLFGIGDAKKIAELNERLREAGNEQEILTKKLMEIKDELGEIEEELRGISPIENEKLERMEIRKREIESKLKLITNELNKKEEEWKKIEEDFSQLEEKIRGKEKEIERLEELKKRKEKELMSIAEKEAMKAVSILKEEIEKLKEEERNILGEIRTTEKEKEIISSKREEWERKKKENEEKIREIEELLKNEERNYEESRNELKTYEEMERKIISKTKGLAEERDRLYKEIVELENKIDTISTKIETSIDLISKAKARLPTLESALAEVMEIEYEFKEEDIPSIDEIKKRIKELEEKIQKMQPINMRALEEYERQDERRRRFEEDYAQLKEQRDNLMKLEKEIKKKKKETFYQVFNEIKDNFSRIYKELTEGEGELILENPENPFEGGLIIKVKPAGKRALHLHALSGGEKSIASLAFIFSLQAYEPSPFYVLDEIDMFLDEKNAEKIARMLAQNASHAQFIVVSLRRITLKHAHHIYGVTMNKGISTMIGNVNMREVEEMVEVQ